MIFSALEHLPGSLNELYEQGKLEGLPGLGKGMLEKIGTILNTGKLSAYEELKREFLEGVIELLSIPNMGPKTVKLIYEKAGVKNIEELEVLVRSHKLRDFPGMGGLRWKRIF